MAERGVEGKVSERRGHFLVSGEGSEEMRRLEPAARLFPVTFLFPFPIGAG